MLRLNFKSDLHTANVWRNVHTVLHDRTVPYSLEKPVPSPSDLSTPCCPAHHSSPIASSEANTTLTLRFSTQQIYAAKSSALYHVEALFIQAAISCSSSYWSAVLIEGMKRLAVVIVLLQLAGPLQAADEKCKVDERVSP